MDNQISISFTEEEIKKVNDAVAVIAEALKGKTIALTPQQRQQFGRVKYEKEIWIDRVKQQMDANPSHIPTYINKTEFDTDYKAHKQVSAMMTALQQQLDLLGDTHLLLGYDLDTTGLMFYRSIKTSATNNAVGAKTIYDELKQQFVGHRKSSKTKDTPVSE